MMPDCVRQFIYQCRGCLAAVLARFRLHKIHYIDQDGHAMVVKSRRPDGHFAIQLGNFYLQLQKCDVEILRTDEWIRWEKAVRAAMTVADGEQKTEFSVGGSLTFSRSYVPGSSLRDLLKEARNPEQLKFSAIEWAVNSLCQLHRLQADWGSGMIQSVSHGDATVNNVIVDIDLRQATWIDFDMRHSQELSEFDRHIDDVRAFVFSAAVYLPVSSFPRLAKIVIASLTDQGLLDQFRERLTNEWRRLNTFQMAQAQLSWNARNVLTGELLNSLADGPLVLTATAVESD